MEILTKAKPYQFKPFNQKASNDTMNPLLREGVAKIEVLLNDFDCDFTLIKEADNHAIIRNKSQCLGKCHQNKALPFIVCDDLEHMIGTQLKTINSHLAVSVNYCACDKDDHCEFMISLDSW